MKHTQLLFLSRWIFKPRSSQKDWLFNLSVLQKKKHNFATKKHPVGSWNMSHFKASDPKPMKDIETKQVWFMGDRLLYRWYQQLGIPPSWISQVSHGSQAGSLCPMPSSVSQKNCEIKTLKCSMSSVASMYIPIDIPTLEPLLTCIAYNRVRHTSDPQ